MLRKGEMIIIMFPRFLIIVIHNSFYPLSVLIENASLTLPEDNSLLVIYMIYIYTWVIYISKLLKSLKCSSKED